MLTQIVVSVGISLDNKILILPIDSAPDEEETISHPKGQSRHLKYQFSEIEPT
jgi:hypothetical protein